MKVPMGSANHFKLKAKPAAIEAPAPVATPAQATVPAQAPPTPYAAVATPIEAPDNTSAMKADGSKDKSLYIYIVFAKAALVAAVLGWVLTNPSVEPSPAELALNDVNARIELIVRRWQAAQRSMEEVQTLEVTIAEWQAQDFQNLLPNAQSALLMHEANLTRDRDTMVSALSALSITQSEQGGVVEEGLRKALEGAKAGYRLEEQVAIEELIRMLPAPVGVSTETYFSEQLNRRFSL